MQTIMSPAPAGSTAPFDARLPDRFWAKVQINAETGCWEWTAQKSHNGYGRFQVGRSAQRAHRVAYESLAGQVPDGLVLDHLCRVRHCVNPAHLEPVTQAENIRRGEAASRKGWRLNPKPSCPQGHPFDEANTYIRPNSGRRMCRTCMRARKRRNRSKAPLPRRNPLSAVFRKAARLIVANGHFQGDHVPDPFDREMCIPHFLRPMSIVAALKCAVSGDPHITSLLADAAIAVLALRLDGGPEFGDIFSLEAHVDEWGDVQDRTAESVVAVLEAAADAVEVTA